MLLRGCCGVPQKLASKSVVGAREARLPPILSRHSFLQMNFAHCSDNSLFSRALFVTAASGACPLRVPGGWAIKRAGSGSSSRARWRCAVQLAGWAAEGGQQSSPHVVHREAMAAEDAGATGGTRLRAIKNAHARSSGSPGSRVARPEQYHRPSCKGGGEMAHARIVTEVERGSAQPGCQLAQIRGCDRSLCPGQRGKPFLLCRAPDFEHVASELVAPAPGDLCKALPILGWASTSGVDQEGGTSALPHCGFGGEGSSRVEGDV